MIDVPTRTALEQILEDRVRFDVPMSRHTSLRVGGPADALAMPRNREELARLLEICSESDLRHTVLGSGFNTLVADSGIDGVVIQMRSFRELAVHDGVVFAEVGVSHSRITKLCVERGLSGLEFGAGIPGTVGGWVAMNAGIGDREVVDVAREIEVIGPTGKTQRLHRNELEFSYRALRGPEPGAVIVAAYFEVETSTPEAVRAEVDRLLAKRATTQPLDVPSCGSVFKNPKGDFAGRLIEAAGLKGLRVGGAEISPLHANFIANVGGATAADVLALIMRAQECVARETGVELETEVKVLGRAQ